MPVKRTSKYQLSQWEKTDQVLMEDFNTDNLNVENALAGLEASKANQTDLAALTNTVNTKVNQTDLASLRTEVAAKAAQTALDTLNTTVTKLTNTLATAQASIPKIVIDSYTGDGQQDRTILLGFTPKAVLVMSNHGAMMYEEQLYDQHWGGLAVTNSPVISTRGNITVLEIVTNGFTVHYQLVSNSNNAYTNNANKVYNYIAFG